LKTENKHDQKHWQNREEDKIHKSRQRDAKNLEVKLALLEIEKSKEKELRRKVSSKLAVHAENREKSLEVTVEKLKLEDKKVEDAKTRKVLSPRPSVLDPKELEMMTPRPSPRNLDELPVAAALKKT
jgi:hypothetical protein